MKPGDLVYDRSICQYGIIIETKKWSQYHEEDPEFEHTILYENGELDYAYENELWNESQVESASRADNNENN
jgi:hypothetical protein